MHVLRSQGALMGSENLDVGKAGGIIRVGAAMRPMRPRQSAGRAEMTPVEGRRGAGGDAQDARGDPTRVLRRLARALNRLFAAEEGRVGLCARSFELGVRCDVCGEVIHLRVDRDHELQSIYQQDVEEGAQPQEYLLTKEVVGEGCQNLIRFSIRFDCDHGVIEFEIEGGEFVQLDRGREPVPADSELVS